MLIEPKIWRDERGYFFESYQSHQFREAGIEVNFVQDNISTSKLGVIRGLHAQAGAQAQGKLVRVLKGRVWDVAVDIRRNSPTFGSYYSVELSAKNNLSLWIPPGFLHGFMSLEENSVFAYKVTGLYDPKGELGVRWNDPDIAIEWPSIPEVELPIISEKDQQLPLLRDIVSPF